MFSISDLEFRCERPFRPGTAPGGHNGINIRFDQCFQPISRQKFNCPFLRRPTTSPFRSLMRFARLPLLSRVLVAVSAEGRRPAIYPPRVWPEAGTVGGGGGERGEEATGKSHYFVQKRTGYGNRRLIAFAYEPISRTDVFNHGLHRVKTAIFQSDLTVAGPDFRRRKLAENSDRNGFSIMQDVRPVLRSSPRTFTFLIFDRSVRNSPLRA